MKIIQAVLLLLFICYFSMPLSGQNSIKGTNTSAIRVIEAIIKNTGASPIPNTVDIIKEGDPQTPVKGIVTCIFVTMDVLKQTVDKKCNLIIVHEPIYYNHLDDTKPFQNDPVFLEKKRFINDHKLVIWRFHDYIHSIRPDGIQSGMLAKLGWKDYAVDGHFKN